MPISFYILGGFTLICAVAAMSLRNLVHCALALALAFAGIAALFLSLGASFVAFGQLLVYVGAVAILIVFAILLTKGNQPGETERALAIPSGLAIAALVFAGLIYGLGSFSGAADGTAVKEPPVAKLGEQLMTTYVPALELMGLLLTVALMGGVIIAMSERAGEGPKR